MTALAHQTPAIADQEEPNLAGEEQRLVQQARHDPAAVSVLYRLHCRPVWVFLWHMTADRDAADDLLMDVFVDFIRALPRLQAGSVRGWLYRVAARRACRWRRRRRWRLLSRSVEAPAASGPPDDREPVRRALSRVPDRLRTVLVLHHVEGLSIEEVAHALGLRVGTVKSRLSRGREALRRRLPPEDRP